MCGDLRQGFQLKAGFRVRDKEESNCPGSSSFQIGYVLALLTKIGP